MGRTMSSIDPSGTFMECDFFWSSMILILLPPEVVLA
jgi:hypothetical protein